MTPCTSSWTERGKELCETYDPLEFAVKEALDL